MKKVILTMLLLLTVPLGSWAADTLQFSWSKYEGGSVTGFRLYQDIGEKFIVTGIPPDKTSVSIPVPIDGECHNYWIRAYRGADESLNSNIATYCPPDKDPPPATRPITVGGVKITIIVEETK